jgi:hypothetical protein
MEGEIVSDWEAERTQYADCWFLWVHGGEVDADGSHIASIKWPRAKALTIPQKVVMMSEASFAELAHFSEIGRKRSKKNNAK